MTPPIEYMLVAAAMGAIVGLVNEYRKISGAKVLMGLRTSIFVSLLGYSTALLYQISSSPSVLVAGIAAAVVVASSVYLGRASVTRNLGATTYVAMILMFFAGTLAGMGMYQYGFALSVLLAALSLYKTELLGAISKIRREELLAVVNLLVISAVILPMLPNKYMGPYDAFNPYEFWLTVVIVGLIFFVQYLILRTMRGGLLAFTFVGSVISSTTATLSLVELANNRRDLGRAAALNIAMSNVPMMIFQVALVLYVVGGGRALSAALPALVAGLGASAVLGGVGWRALNPRGVEPPETPLPILRTFEFAALLFVIVTASKIVEALVPQALPATIALSSLANVLSSVYAVGVLYAKGQITAAAAGYLASTSMLVGAAEKVALSMLIKDRGARASALGATAAATAAIAAAVVLFR